MWRVTSPAHFLRIGAIAAGLLVGGCDDGLETEPVDRPPAGGGTAVDGFILEPWAVGDRWYLYDGRTHTLAPRDEAYLVQTDGGTALFVVEGYYGASGESGVFTLSHRSAEGAQWSASETMTLTGNVKDGPACVALGPWRQVACEDPDAALVFRTDRRVLPAAGFVVANPAIYEMGHPEQRVVELAVLDRDAWNNPPSDLAGALDEGRRASAALTRAEWPIGLLDENEERSWLQAATSFSLIHWHAEVQDGEVHLRSRCVPLAITEAEQSGFDSAAVQEASLLAPDVGASVWIRLCPDIQTVGTTPSFFLGTWPDSRDFDLLLEGHRDGVALRPAPGSLLYQQSESDPSLVREPDVPATLWQ